MVKIISTASMAGDYRGEDGADGWVYLPEKDPQATKEKKSRKKSPTPKPRAPKPQTLEGGTSLLKEAS